VHIGRAVGHATAAVVFDAGEWGAHAAVALWNTAGQASSRVYHAATSLGHDAVNAVRTAYHGAARAATATVTYVKHHAAAIASIAVSVVVFAGCEAVLTGVSGGALSVPGAVACGALAGAAGGAVSYAVTAAQTGHFSVGGLGKAVLGGAVMGGLTAGLIGGAGAALGGLLRSGAADAAAALSTTAADEAATATTESAATTADATGRSAAQDTAARSAGEDSQRSESCLIGGQSFTAATKVRTASGALVAISTLKAGQQVLATDTKTGQDRAEPVAAVLVHHDTDLYDVKVRAGHRTAVIHTTSGHPFWDQSSGRWVKAAALTYGTHLRTPGSGTATILGGSSPRARTGWMWDLTVTRDHDFYIQAATTTILVHNCNGAADLVATNAGSGRAYSVAFRTELPESAYPGLSRGAHFQMANRQLLQAMNDDAEFSSMMDELSPGIGTDLVGPGGGISRSSPAGWTWHHATDEGVMELVPRVQHQAPGPIQDLLHPGGVGGYSIWGR
jgi:hypothetical protein